MSVYETTLWALLLHLALVSQVCEGSRYKAGVVEYYYDVKSELSPNQILDNNLEEYKKIANKFSQTWPDVQDGILVFPECGLSSCSKSQLVPVQVPNPDYLRTDFTKFQVISNLSKAANELQIWLVVNLIELDGDKKYNSDVVFRSNGTIAAKYRKYNLFGEAVDRPTTAEVVSFPTDFGITFGMFTCFDILFREPALTLVLDNVKHFIFPTAWFSELPFLTAVQFQKSWSWMNNVTLLASGLSYSQDGSTGSGIYRRRTGQDVYVQTTDSKTSKLIMAVLDTEDKDIVKEQGSRNTTVHDTNTANDQNNYIVTPSHWNDENQVPNQESVIVETRTGPNSSGLLLKHEPLDAYTTSMIGPEQCTLDQKDVAAGQVYNCSKYVEIGLCNHGLCCDFRVRAVFSVYVCQRKDCEDAAKYRPKDIDQDDFSRCVHRLAVFSGVRSFDVVKGGVQTCAVVSCRDLTLPSCGLTPAPRDLDCFQYANNLNVCVIQRYIFNVSIGGNFDQINTFITPNILLRGNAKEAQFGKLTNDFELKGNETGYYRLQYNVSEEDSLGTAAIWSRVFDNDGPITGNSSSSLSYSVAIAFTIALVYPTVKMLKRL